MRKMVWLVAAVALICSAVVVAEERTKDAKEQTNNVIGSRGNLDCSFPTVIDCNTTLYGEDNIGWPNNVNSFSCVAWTETGGERVYELSVDANTRIIVSLEPTQGDPDVFLLGSCDEDDCLAVGEEGFSYNALEDEVYYIVVDGHLDGPDVVYDLTVSCEEASPPPANDTCDGAIDLENQGLPEFEVNLCDYTNQYDPLPFGCTGYRALGPEAVFKIDLDEEGWFRASIGISDGFIDHSLYLITDCDDPVGSCVVGSDENSFFPRPEFISYQAGAPGTYFMMVDSYLDCGGGLTDVWFSTQPPPVNDTCDGAIDLEEQGLPEFIIDLRIYTNQVGANGPEAIYKIDLDEGQVFSACVESVEFDALPSLYLVTDCEDVEGSLVVYDPNCIFYPADTNGTYYLFVDSGGHGGPVEVSYETGGPFTGLVGYYPFFGDAADHSGYGHDGAVYGATLTEDRFGNPEAAYHFDGVDDYIEIDDIFPFMLTSWTIAAWFRVDSDMSLSKGLVCKPEDPATDHTNFIILVGSWSEGDNLIRADFETCGDDHNHALYSETIVQGEWYFIVYTKDHFSGETKLYVNDYGVVTYEAWLETPCANNIPLWIGKFNDPDSEFEGIIDDVRIYTHAITAEEVLELYSAPSHVDIGDGVPGRTKLLGCYPNPFNPQTTISFSLARDEQAEISVYDLTGRLVRVLASRTYPAGDHSVGWNGKDAAGREVPSGSYLVRLTTESGVEARKVMLLR